MSADPARRRSAAVSHEHTFEAIYRGHHDFVWRVLFGLGVRPEQLDDATQETFVIVYRRLDCYDRSLPLRSWLFGIARNVSRKQRTRKLSDRRWLELVEEPVSLEVDPWGRVLQGEAARIVQSALDDMDETQRHVFVAMEIEGLSAPELARSLGISVNTIYSRLRLARRKFDKMIASVRCDGSPHAGGTRTCG